MLNSRRKKVVIIGCLLAVIILLFIAIIFFENDKTAPPPKQSSNTITLSPQTEKITIDSISPTKQAPNFPVWNTYKGNSFSLQYPPDWSIKLANLSGGGEALIIRPNVLPPEIIYPQLILQKEPFSKERLDKRIEILRSLGLKQSQTTLFDKNAIKVSGAIPFKAIAGQKVSEPIQETNILLSKNENLYLFQYTYEGDQVTSDLERYFNEIITGVKI